MKKYFSVPLYIVIGLAVLYLGWAAGRAGYYWARALKFEYNWRRAQREYERPFREDKIGGQTPEETWDMFISALEAGGVEKASTYFLFSEREKLFNIISDINKEGKIDEFIKKYQGYFDNPQQVLREGENVKYLYKAHKEAGPSTIIYPDGRTEVKQFPARDYQGEIHFIKNINNFWKIYKL